MIAHNKDVSRPYCGVPQDINHDDGYGYREDVRHEQQCHSCDKIFVYTTSISFYYEAEKADCLNGSEHNFQPTRTYPKEYSQMKCTICDTERECTKEEMQQILNK